jgi:FkbM family methyltransferase
MALFLHSLKSSGRLDQLHMTICNVGSRKARESDDYANSGWDIFAPRLSIYGFDADDDACEAANADLASRQVNWSEKHVPLVLGNQTGASTLYITNSPECSSLYEPNHSYLKRFEEVSEMMELVFQIEIEMTTLDKFCQTEGIEEIDFLQVDVQGADLQVLQGAAQILQSSVLAVQTEVVFSHLYLNQPLFADIDTYLRQCAFTLFDMKMAHRLRIQAPIRSAIRQGQALWGDAFYFRDLIQGDDHVKTPDRIFKLACIADVMYFPDYALELLEYLTLNYGSDRNYNFANHIVAALSTVPDLVADGLSSLPVIQNIRDYIDPEYLKLID